LLVFSSATDSLCLPFALLLERTFLPFFVAMRALNPCLFERFLLDGWNVRFMGYCYFESFVNALRLLHYSQQGRKGSKKLISKPRFVKLFCTRVSDD